MTHEQWCARIDAQMSDGQFFLAYDHYRDAISAGADSLRLHLLGALALLRVGATEEARRLLQPLSGRLELRSEREARIESALRQAIVACQQDPTERTADRTATRQLLNALSSVERGTATDEAEQPDVLRLVSQIHYEIWMRLGNDADLAHAERVGRQCHAASGDFADGLQAVLLSTLRGESDDSARRALDLLADWQQQPLPDDSDSARDRHCAAGALLAVLAGDRDALAPIREALARPVPRHTPTVVTLRARLQQLADAGSALAAEALAALPPPSVVVFSGQPLDDNGCDEPCFPVWLESAVASRITTELDALNAEIGFSSAAAGAELLFVEAMLDRGADVHLVLPFALDDFIRQRVAYAGGNWVRRFRNACKLATTISYATDEPFLGHDMLLRFNNHLIHGMARAQGTLCATDPHLLVLWDYLADSGAGSAADFMDNWPEITRLRLIDLDELREQTAAPTVAASTDTAPAIALASRPPAVVTEPQRTIRTMLFADIVGYSKLAEPDLPKLWECLDAVRPLLADSAGALRLIESWGDAIYAVMETSTDMATYAFALIDAVAAMDAAGAGLSRSLHVRIGLHAGPVFEGKHPLTGRPIVYGSHVSRAARIEPVSLPDHVYASQQFVAMLRAEESARRHEAQMTGGDYLSPYACEYLGVLSLAKNYGRQQVYHLRRRG